MHIIVGNLINIGSQSDRICCSLCTVQYSNTNPLRKSSDFKYIKPVSKLIISRTQQMTQNLVPPLTGEPSLFIEW